MSSDLRPRPAVRTPLRTHRRRGWLLVAVAAFQLWLWGTRIVNLIGDVGSFSAAFIAVHAALYVTAIGVALVVGGLGLRLLGEARAAAAGPAGSGSRADSGDREVDRDIEVGA